MKTIAKLFMDMSLSSVLVSTFLVSAHLELMCFSYCFTVKETVPRNEAMASKPLSHRAAELKSKTTSVGIMSLL